MTITTPQTIKFEIQKAIKRLTTDQLKNEIEVATNSNAPGSIFIFTFGLDELEARLDPMDYQEFENQIVAS